MLAPKIIQLLYLEAQKIMNIPCKDTKCKNGQK